MPLSALVLLSSLKSGENIKGYVLPFCHPVISESLLKGSLPILGLPFIPGLNSKGFPGSYEPKDCVVYNSSPKDLLISFQEHVSRGQLEDSEFAGTLTLYPLQISMNLFLRISV